MEVWKIIKKYPQYEVSNLGRIRSHSRRSLKLGKDQILRSYINRKRGYVTVVLWREGIFERCYVHRLVLEAFQPRHKDKNYVNHIDCNPANNGLKNLEWVTQSDNMKHASKLGRMNHQVSTKRRKILRSDGKIFAGLVEAAKDVGCERQAIWNVCNGYKHRVKGFSFSYL